MASPAVYREENVVRKIRERFFPMGAACLLGLALVVPLAACRTDKAKEVLVLRFLDKHLILRTKVGGRAGLQHHPFKYGDLSCVLATKANDHGGPCATGLVQGSIECDDGRFVPVDIHFTSCNTGYGYPNRPTAKGAIFGLGPNVDRALDQMAQADRQPR